MHSSVAVGVMVCLMVAVTSGQPTHIGWKDNQNENWPSNHALLSMLEYDRQEFRTITNTMIEENKKLKEVVQNLVGENKKLTEDIMKLQNDNKTLSDCLSKLETHDVVAFSTYLDLNYLRPTTDVIVPFNQIVSNVGGHFSSTTHKFRCPVDGYYLFLYSIYSGGIKQGSRDRTQAKLMQGSTVINKVFCINSNSQPINCQVSNSAVLQCRKNTEVYVNTWGSSTQIVGCSNRFTTFSGFLIKSVPI